MFVRKVQKGKGRISLRVVENIKINGKVKQKTICGLGTFREDEEKEIKEFIELGESIIVTINAKRCRDKSLFPELDKDKFAPKKRRKNVLNQAIADGKCSLDKLKEEKRFCVGTEDIFADEYKQLGLFDSIDTGYKQDEWNKLLEKVVLERIDRPESKRKSIENIKRNKKDEEEGIELGRVYRMMDRLLPYESDIKRKIAKQTVSLFKPKIEVCFFDVTTLYFESVVPDDLRVSGYSKDNKTKETQVVLALMTTEEGLPLDYKLFPGNTYEGKTLIESVDFLSKSYDISKTFVVADRGMCREENLRELEKRGINFIIATKLRTMNREIKEHILRDIGLEKEKTRDNYFTREYPHEKGRLIVSYSKKRGDKSKYERDRIVRQLQGKMKDGEIKVADLIKNSGTKKYLKLPNNKSPCGTLDKDKIAEDERWDGIYGVITNCKDNLASHDQILSRHSKLWQIEDAFRVNKHDMKMRPIYHLDTEKD